MAAVLSTCVDDRGYVEVFVDRTIVGGDVYGIRGRFEIDAFVREPYETEVYATGFRVDGYGDRIGARSWRISTAVPDAVRQALPEKPV